MSFQAEWSKEIIKSVNQHFDAAFSGSPYVIQLHGQDIPESDKHDNGKWLEVRIDGPWYRHLHGYYDAKIEVNVLACVIPGENSYVIHDMTGLAAASMAGSISVSKMDNSTRLGCLHMSDDRGEKIQTSYFGIVHAATKIEQATVETHYEITKLKG